jgi:hypothetical protein
MNHPRPSSQTKLFINEVLYDIPIGDMPNNSHIVIPTIVGVKAVAKALAPLATYHQAKLYCQQINWFGVLAVRVVKPSSISWLPESLRSL